jgi:hypothetical protein
MFQGRNSGTVAKIVLPLNQFKAIAKQTEPCLAHLIHRVLNKSRQVVVIA